MTYYEPRHTLTSVDATTDAGGQDGGYVAVFPRVLRRFALFAIAFSVVSITTGIFVNYA